MTTPADELRAAAEKLRKLAQAATPGPWEYDPEPYGYGDDIYYDVDGDNGGWAAHAESQPTAAYIAAMHPGVGLALAEWLEAEAAQAEFADGWESPHSTTLARLINGGAS